jgi:lincosamide nucleotidyltransferase A/C/D/E
MTLDDLCRLIDLLERLGTRIWIEGGWAVDAWLGIQTRRHSDVDIVIEKQDLDVAVAALHERGYRHVPRDDTRPWNFVLGDPAGRQVDVHVIVLDESGNGVYGPPQNGDLYPAEGLAGRVTFCNRSVGAMTPAVLVRFHTGYDPSEKDRADVQALATRFGIKLPAEYRRRPAMG